MHTEDKFLDDEFFVELAGEEPHEKSTYKEVEKEELGGVREEHFGIPIDGWITFYDPNLYEKNDPHKHFTFPFRDHTSDDYPWEAYPKQDKGHKHPIWKWRNPTEQKENITLKPSLGVYGESKDYIFHCFVTKGEVEWK